MPASAHGQRGRARAARLCALRRKSWLFAGSERGVDRAAVMATLIMIAKLNDVDPQAWSPTCSLALPTLHKAASASCCRGNEDGVSAGCRLTRGSDHTAAQAGGLRRTEIPARYISIRDSSRPGDNVR